jgi:hypothetical protein
MVMLIGLLVVVLLLFGFATLVWLLKLLAEIANALAFGIAGGLRLTGRLFYSCALWLGWALIFGVREWRRTVWPALCRGVEWICVWFGIAVMWTGFHARRLYVRRELKARKKR